MLETLTNNLESLIVITCLVGIFYCVFDLTLKIGQATMRRKVEKDVKKYTDRLPANPLEDIEVTQPEEMPETEEEQLDRMLNLNSPKVERPQVKLETVQSHKLKYNSPIKQVKDLMKPRQIKPEGKNSKNGGLESF